MYVVTEFTRLLSAKKYLLGAVTPALGVDEAPNITLRSTLFLQRVLLWIFNKSKIHSWLFDLLLFCSVVAERYKRRGEQQVVYGVYNCA